MKIKDNQVYVAAMRFCTGLRKACAESVFFGYAKLLSMDESLRRNLISDECMEDVEAAHKWFSDNKLDLGLIKSGLSIIIAALPQETAKDREQAFEDLIQEEFDKISSAEILDKIEKLTCIPFREVFAQGNQMSNVFDYLKELESQKPQQSDDNPDNGSEETKSESESVPPKKAEKRDVQELSQKYSKLTTALLDVVKGQDQAVLKFVKGYNQGELLRQTEKGNHPRAFFFFYGPPGVGKTLLATTVADTFDIPKKIFNMGEYASPDTYQDLIGTSAMYRNAKEGVLTEFVRKNPECLLIFDEIEKAHPLVLRQFLQILGSGEVHNVTRDEETSFRDATIIFTSNVGKDLYEDRSLNLTALPEKVIIDALVSEKNAYDMPVLPPELCSRLASGNVIAFNHISVRHLLSMIEENFDRIAECVRKEYGIDIRYSDKLPVLFMYNRGSEIDARVAMGQSGRFIKDEIYELLRQIENKSTQNEIKSIEISVDTDGMDEELTSLFINQEKSDIVVFSENTDFFESLGGKQSHICVTKDLNKAEELLKGNVDAVFIDPFSGKDSSDSLILSISDYSTSGVKLFHQLVSKQSDLPIYLIEMDHSFSEVDRQTFIQEGATGTVVVNTLHPRSFKRQLAQIMSDLYMEKQNRIFSQRGFVLDYNTKQEMDEETGEVRIVFYDIRKRIAVDVESRGSILSDAERPNVKFKDVIGAKKAKEELSYFIQYLKNPRQFLMAGETPPRGVLLYGPPGTGKTMLARAMAGESDVTFLQTSATEFMDKYVGGSEENIRKIFQKAKKYAPAIVFIDEIDAIGKKRTGSDGSQHTESMLNALLTEMDGFSSTDVSRPVFVLAATNYGVGREDDGVAELDIALSRRFKHHIYVALPTESERKEYLCKLMKDKKVTGISEGTVQNIAERTTGQSLAILQNVFELAQRNAVRAGKSVEDGDLLSALEEYIYGEKKEHTPEYYRNVAIHETGHAVISYLGGDKPSYITIESRGNFGGYMQHANQEEVTGYSREDVLARIRTALAGRAAEQVFLGKDESLNTGASSDLKSATDWAFRMVLEYGMEGDQLIVLDKQKVLNSPMASEYIHKINEILKTEMNNTIALIQENKDKIQAIADVLVQENRLTGAQFEELMQKN